MIVRGDELEHHVLQVLEIDIVHMRCIVLVVVQLAGLGLVLAVHDLFVEFGGRAVPGRVAVLQVTVAELLLRLLGGRLIVTQKQIALLHAFLDVVNPLVLQFDGLVLLRKLIL